MNWPLTTMNLPWDDKKLRLAIALYNRQYVFGIFDSKLIQFMYDGFPEGSGLIVSYDSGGVFKGALDYFVYDEVDEFVDRLSRGFTRPLHDSNGRDVNNGGFPYEGRFFYLSILEAFEKRQGVGRNLVKCLKNYVGSDNLFVLATGGYDFYKKVGFRDIGLYVDDSEIPLMVFE